MHACCQAMNAVFWGGNLAATPLPLTSTLGTVVLSSNKCCAALGSSGQANFSELVSGQDPKYCLFMSIHVFLLPKLLSANAPTLPVYTIELLSASSSSHRLSPTPGYA